MTETHLTGPSLRCYRVDVNYQDEPDRTKMLELNRASAEMKRVFDPYVRGLDPQLEEDSSEPSSEAAEVH